MGQLNTLLYLAIASIVAFFAKRGTSKIGLPIVTGYVISGVILGISVLKIFHLEILDRLDIVNDFALGIIGFTIGSELRKSVFKQLGKSIILIALFESVGAFIIVSVSIYIMDPSKIYQALIMGAVSSATAPAATVYVIQQYKAKGPLTSTILAVVGIDDAFALIIFVFASIVAKNMMMATHMSIVSVIAAPVVEILSAISLGLVSSIVYVLLFRKVRFPDELLLGLSGFLLFTLGIAHQFHLSSLLAAMSFGVGVTNMNAMLTNRSTKIAETLSPLFFAYFFIFAGAHLNIGLFPKIGFMGLIYLLARIIGKVGGASLGAIVGKAQHTVRKYIGFSLVPQVGVAIALAIVVKKEFGGGDFGEAGTNLAVLVINILLFTTIITEVLGPVLTKWALTKAGERQE